MDCCLLKGSLRGYDGSCNEIELCVKLSLLRLFHVGRVVQNKRSALSLAWHECFSCKGKDWNIYCCGLALSSEPQIGSLRSTTRLQRRRYKICILNCQKQKFCTPSTCFFLIPCISFKFSANLRREMTISQVLQRTWTLRRKFEYSFLALTPHL